MTRYAEILDDRESMRGAFFGAIALHVTIIGAIVLQTWLQGHPESFGAKDAGGSSIGVEAVNSIPLQHHGPQNPLANDTKSDVPQTPAKPVERAKEEKPPPDAIPIKSRQAKKPLSQVASERQRFRPFEELEKNQVTSKQAPQVSNPLYSATPGAGRVGTGANTTLGTRFAGYAQQIQQLVAQKWRTGDVDASIQTAPTVIATFDLERDGSVRNVVLLQRSGISSLDFSVQRAILEASPFPPIPPGFDRDYAKVEFTFELKR
jgi:TonB family protein